MTPARTARCYRCSRPAPPVEPLATPLCLACMPDGACVVLPRDAVAEFRAARPPRVLTVCPRCLLATIADDGRCAFCGPPPNPPEHAA